MTWVPSYLIMQMMNKFNKQRARTWRWTRQRRTIIAALEGRKDHPTAEELYRSLKDQGADISLATVYRTLRALAQEGAILEIHGDGPDRFDPNPTPHYHFRCTRCGRVYDVDLAYRQDLDRIELGSGFHITGHQLIWEGTCPKCQMSEG